MQKANVRVQEANKFSKWQLFYRGDAMDSKVQ